MQPSRIPPATAAILNALEAKLKLFLAEQAVAQAIDREHAAEVNLKEARVRRKRFIESDLRGARWLAENKWAREEWDRILDRFAEGPKVV